MKPHALIAALVRGTKKPPLQVAREMKNANFQGTLHKFMAGNVASPKRSTAEVIAAYFDLPVDALYDDAVASRIAVERGVTAAAGAASAAVREHAPPVYMEAHPSRAPRFAADVERRILRLSESQRLGLETIMRAYLDTLAPTSASAKTRRP